VQDIQVEIVLLVCGFDYLPIGEHEGRLVIDNNEYAPLAPANEPSGRQQGASPTGWRDGAKPDMECPAAPTGNEWFELQR
jgi:hypothetical protein